MCVCVLKLDESVTVPSQFEGKGKNDAPGICAVSLSGLAKLVLKKHLNFSTAEVEEVYNEARNNHARDEGTELYQGFQIFGIALLEFSFEHRTQTLPGSGFPDTLQDTIAENLLSKDHAVLLTLGGYSFAIVNIGNELLIVDPHLKEWKRIKISFVDGSGTNETEKKQRVKEVRDLLDNTVQFGDAREMAKSEAFACDVWHFNISNCT